MSEKSWPILTELRNRGWFDDLLGSRLHRAAREATMTWDNRFELTVHDEQLEAQRVAHILIAAGLEANIVPRFSVTVPKDQENRAQNALYLDVERRARQKNSMKK